MADPEAKGVEAGQFVMIAVCAMIKTSRSEQGMRAMMLERIQHPRQLKKLCDSHLGDGEARLRVEAFGVCSTDLTRSS